ncbi:hypothetical protein FM076_05840 [Streptomyces albus subsp. chlorinus]|uniref:hypothetical protein n=1 Tax=Streptomyces albus TaxID=1888 RepID=UPI0015701AA7|nr:hypothetical protein [Streptomyces albus]NSC20747.1 hypothetical protein [Streptomyces albus subsp. chlorinus]
MINIPLDAEALAATRFAVSPLMQVGTLPHPHRPRTVRDNSLFTPRSAACSGNTGWNCWPQCAS